MNYALPERSGEALVSRASPSPSSRYLPRSRTGLSAVGPTRGGTRTGGAVYPIVVSSYRPSDLSSPARQTPNQRDHRHRDNVHLHANKSPVRNSPDPWDPGQECIQPNMLPYKFSHHLRIEKAHHVNSLRFTLANVRLVGCRQINLTASGGAKAARVISSSRVSPSNGSSRASWMLTSTNSHCEQEGDQVCWIRTGWGRPRLKQSTAQR